MLALQAGVPGGWANVKNGLGNLAASDVDQRTAIIKDRLNAIQYRPALSNGFLAQTGLTRQPPPR
jgi:putative transposase